MGEQFDKIKEIFSEKKLYELIKVKMECDEIDFKEVFNPEDKRFIIEISKDIIAFSNTRPGYLIFGVTDDFIPIGLQQNVNIDISDLSNKINAYVTPTPKIYFKKNILKINNSPKEFAFLYVEPTDDIFMSRKDGEFKNKNDKQEKIFRSGEIFVRSGGSSVRPDSYALKKLIDSKRKFEETKQIKELSFNIEDKYILKRENIIRPDYIKFIGRERNIEIVINALMSRFFIVSISGIGGVGKTALAREIAEKVYNEGLFEGVIWTSAKLEKLSATGIEKLFESPTNLTTLLNMVLSTYGYDILKYKDEDKKPIVLGILRKIKTMIVIDNYETITDGDLKRFIDEVPDPSKILITTREHYTGNSKNIVLDPMTRIETQELIQSYAYEKNIIKLQDASYRVYKEIYDATGGIPLAIKWTVGMIGLSFEKRHTLRALHKPDSPVLEFCFKEIYENVLTDESKTILLSFPVYDENPDLKMIEKITDISGDSLTNSIIDLIQLSLINEYYETGDSNPKYLMLPLTRSFTLLKLMENKGLEIKLKQKYNEYKAYDLKSIKTIKELGNTLESLGAKTESSKIAALQAQAAYSTYQNGNYIKSIDLFKEAINNDPKFVLTYILWGRVEKNEGNVLKAMELFNAAKKIDKTNEEIWINLGLLSEKVNNMENAREYYLEGIKYSKTIEKVEYLLAMLESKSQNFEKAIELYQKLFNSIDYSYSNINNKVLYATGLAETYRTWGVNEAKKGNYNEALSKYLETIKILTEASKHNNNNKYLIKTSKLTFKNLGQLYFYINQLDKSEGNLISAINISDSSPFWREHNSICYTLLAKIYMKIGNLTKALKYCDMGLAQYPNRQIIVLQEQIINKINK